MTWARPVSTSRIAFVKDVEPAAVPAVDIYDLKGLANNFKFLYDMYTYQSPIEFQGDVVTSRLQKTVHKLGAIEWGCWAPFFPNGLIATKCQFIFNNLDIGGIFPCYNNSLRFQQLHIQGHSHVVFKNCTCKGTSLLDLHPPISIKHFLENAKLILINP